MYRPVNNGVKQLVSVFGEGTGTGFPNSNIYTHSGLLSPDLGTQTDERYDGSSPVGGKSGGKYTTLVEGRIDRQSYGVEIRRSEVTPLSPRGVLFQTLETTGWKYKTSTTKWVARKVISSHYHVNRTSVGAHGK